MSITSPGDISGLVLWMDPDSLAEADGTQIALSSVIADSSGHGHTCQAVSGRQPWVYTFNGHRVLQFRQAQAVRSSDAPPVTDDFTIIQAYWPLVSGGSTAYYGSAGALWNAEVPGVANDLGTAIGPNTFVCGTGNPDRFAYGNWQRSRWSVSAFERTRASGAIRAFVNDPTTPIGTNTGNTNSLTAPTSWGVGGCVSNGASEAFYYGYYGGCLIYNRVLTDAERADAMAWLLARYATPGNDKTAWFDAVVALNPRGYWQLNEMQGSGLFADEMGLNTLTISGTPGVVGGAIAKDPDDTAAFFAGSPVGYGGSGIYTGGAITLAAWVKLDSTGHYYGHIAGTRNDSDADCYILQLNASNQLECRLRTTAGVRDIDPFISVGGWHWVVMTWDGATYTLYVDGVSVGSAALGGTLPARNQFRIGRDPNSNYYYYGSVDDVFVLPNALTASDVANLYALATQPPSTSPGDHLPAAVLTTSVSIPQMPSGLNIPGATLAVLPPKTSWPLVGTPITVQARVMQVGGIRTKRITIGTHSWGHYPGLRPTISRTRTRTYQARINKVGGIRLVRVGPGEFRHWGGIGGTQRIPSFPQFPTPTTWPHSFRPYT